MLHERRIVVTSKKLSRVTAVVHAAASLLYPMFWYVTEDGISLKIIDLHIHLYFIATKYVLMK